jgi:hypothetical protein
MHKVWPQTSKHWEIYHGNNYYSCVECLGLMNEMAFNILLTKTLHRNNRLYFTGLHAAIKNLLFKMLFISVILQGLDIIFLF